jgi:hypothetical protein
MQPAHKKQRFDSIQRNLDASFDNILDFHLPTLASIELTNFIKRNFSEAEICCMFDYPGVGKTSTCVHAAKQADAVYIRFYMGGLLIQSTNNIVERYSEEFFAGGSKSAQEVFNFIENICVSTVARLITIAVGNLADSSIINSTITIPESFSEYRPDVYWELLNEKLKLLLHVTKKRKVLIHADECQAWLYDNDFSKLRDTTYGKRFTRADSYMNNYKLPALSACLAAVMNNHLDSVVIAMSGTNTNAFKRVAIDAQIKIVTPTIPYLIESDIRKIVDHYFDISHLEDETRSLDVIYKKLRGPARQTRHFLKYLSFLNTMPKESVEYSHIESAEKQTHALFIEQMNVEHLSDRLPIYNAMTVISRFPGYVGGKVGTDQTLKDAIEVPVHLESMDAFRKFVKDQYQITIETLYTTKGYEVHDAIFNHEDEEFSYQ